MEKNEAEKIIRRAQDLVARHNVQDLVEVDELNPHRDWQQDTFVEVNGGTYVKAWVFVPSVP